MGPASGQWAINTLSCNPLVRAPLRSAKALSLIRCLHRGSTHLDGDEFRSQRRSAPRRILPERRRLAACPKGALLRRRAHLVSRHGVVACSRRVCLGSARRPAPTGERHWARRLLLSVACGCERGASAAPVRGRANRALDNQAPCVNDGRRASRRRRGQLARPIDLVRGDPTSVAASALGRVVASGRTCSAASFFLGVRSSLLGCLTRVAREGHVSGDVMREEVQSGGSRLGTALLDLGTGRRSGSAGRRPLRRLQRPASHLRGGGAAGAGGGPGRARDAVLGRRGRRALAPQRFPRRPRGGRCGGALRLRRVAADAAPWRGRGPGGRASRGGEDDDDDVGDDGCVMGGQRSIEGRPGRSEDTGPAWGGSKIWPDSASQNRSCKGIGPCGPGIANADSIAQKKGQRHRVSSKFALSEDDAGQIIWRPPLLPKCPTAFHRSSVGCRHSLRIGMVVHNPSVLRRKACASGMVPVRFPHRSPCSSALYSRARPRVFLDRVLLRRPGRRQH